MKYINHMTSSHDDEKHRAAMDLAGLQAYGAYWIICEKIAAQIRPECVSTSLKLSWKSWASSLQVDPRVARRLVRVLGESRLAIVEETDSGARVNIPNLLKYADEYTKKVLKKSGQTPDKLPTMSGLPALPALPDKQNLKASSVPDGPPTNGFSPNDMMQLWNDGVEFYKQDTHVVIPRINEVTPERRKKALSRIKDCQIDEAKWRAVINAVHQSDFLSGKKPSEGHGNWKADFDFVIKTKTHIVKILEGGYQ